MQRQYQATQYTLFFALACVLISVITWHLDITGVVHACSYCRVERSIIGFLGLLLLIPQYENILLKMLAYQLGFLGAVIASMQIFLHIKDGLNIDLFMLMAYAALNIIIVQTYLLHFNFSIKA